MPLVSMRLLERLINKPNYGTASFKVNKMEFAFSRYGYDPSLISTIVIRIDLATFYGARDYSRVGGHTTKSVTHSAITQISAGMPQVVGEGSNGSESSGGDGGGSGEDGGDGDGDGDGEPPISAGPAPDSGGQNWRSRFLKFLLRPFRFLWNAVPSLRCTWFNLKFLFPDAVRKDVYRPHARSLFRDHRLARRKPISFRLWMGFCLRVRTCILLLCCTLATLKHAGVEKGMVPGL